MNGVEDPPPTFPNYLDDFLQAVRVFGFVSRLFGFNANLSNKTFSVAGEASTLLSSDNSYAGLIYCPLGVP